MLRSLRWKLTLAFILVIFLFAAVVGAGGYFVLRQNYNRTVDTSLKYRMAIQYDFYGYTLPTSLQEAKVVWAAEQAGPLQSANLNPIAFAHDLLEGGESEHEDEGESGIEDHEGAEGISENLTGPEVEELLEGAYSSDLALVFVFPLDANCQLWENPNPFNVPMEPNNEACASAMQNGSDLRTVSLENGDRVRLLSYHVNAPYGPAVIQTGRSLADQDRTLLQLIIGVSAVGLALMLFAGISSWWLAGRSLGPAQRAWDQQRAFIANASHELRTPLTLMRASAEVALRGKLGKKEKTHVQDIVHEADYMGRLVDDLLLLSRLDSGRLTLECEPVDVSELLDEIQRQAAKLAGDHEFVPAMDIPAVQLKADPIRVRQILLILLDNAFKHTPAGTRVWLETELEKEFLVLRVRDDGPGIPAEHLPHIFDRFYQASSSPEGQDRSNGLGLSIARGLTELHGGSIRAASGPGTTFEVRLPR